MTNEPNRYSFHNVLILDKPFSLKLNSFLSRPRRKCYQDHVISIFRAKIASVKFRSWKNLLKWHIMI